MEVFFVSLDPCAKPAQVTVFPPPNCLSLLPLNPTFSRSFLQHRVVVPKAGKVSDLCSALSEMTGVAPTQVCVSVRVF